MKRNIFLIKYISIPSIVLLSYLTYSCSKKNLFPIRKLIVGDSLRIDLSLYELQAANYFKRHKNLSLRKLRLYDSEGWLSLYTYELDGEKHIGLMDLENSKMVSNPKPLLQEIGNVKNIEVLILSTLELNKLPHNISQLKKLKEIDLSFNPINWEETIPQLKNLPNLKLLKAYGTNLNRDQFLWLSQEIQGLEVRYNLAHYVEDNNIQNYSDDE